MGFVITPRHAGRVAGKCFMLAVALSTIDCGVRRAHAEAPVRAPDHRPGTDSIAIESKQASAAPTVLVHNQGVGFPAPFERLFDFGQLPFPGEYRDVTLDGIRLRADGLRHWVHLDGSPVGERVARQPDAAERWTIDLPPGSHALEFRIWESTVPGVGANTCYNVGFCTDTLYRVRVFGDAGAVLRDFDFAPADDRDNTVAIWSSVPIRNVVLTAEVNNVDDEFFGDVRVGSRPLPAGLRYLPSRQHAGFGRLAALGGGRALIVDDRGFESWRRTETDGWSYQGRRDIDGTIERIAVDASHAVLVLATPAGPRLRIHEIQGDDPMNWPTTEVAYSGAARDLAIEGDVIALGVDGAVRMHRRVPGTGWQFEQVLTPDPPITGANEFGRNLGLDGGQLVVNAGRGLFHVYARGAGSMFNEVYRQEQVVTNRSFVDISGNTIAVQGFEGGLTLYSAAAMGNWAESGSASGALPAGFGVGLGAAVRIDGDTLLTLQDFQNSASTEFRQVVSVWVRESDGRLVRTAVLVDPHLLRVGSARLGSFGQAFELDGDDVVLGHPGTTWCDYGTRAFFGDDGAQGYSAVCEGRSGAVIVADARVLGILFASGFEP